MTGRKAAHIIPPKPAFPTHAWLYAGSVTLVLTTLFHDDAAILGGVTVWAAMTAIWLFKSGVRKFFCRLFLLVPALMGTIDILLLCRKG
jgi:hypothetical protein